MGPTNIYLLIAAIVALLVGVIHSVLGELLIFRRLRAIGIIPKESAPPLQSRHIRILWATWHLASVFGFACAGILLSLARSGSAPRPELVNMLVAAFACGSGLVLFATKGKHPGWLGLLLVAILASLGNAIE